MLPDDQYTFLFTDIEGSTRLWESYPKEMPAALTQHDRLLRQALETHHGSIFKNIGDGMLAVFQDTGQAAAAAMQAQYDLSAAPWGITGPLHVRMAIHSGPAQVRQGDYFGPTLNRAARLLAAGYGGQILVSQAASRLLESHLPPKATLHDLGEKRLKDLNRPEHVYQLVAPDLPDQFPLLKTVDAYPNNLPCLLTSFIGREKEIANIKRLLEKTHDRQHAERLITLVGTGGTGKTRLSLQAAAESLEYFPEGVWLVELASISDPALVASTTASVFSLNQDPRRSPESILTAHIGTKRILVILDNCEHLIDACARLADELLRACPQLYILTSSREPLGIPGETILYVPSLSMPDLHQLPPDHLLAEYEAVRLFTERAQSVHPGFHLTPENAAVIAQVCYRLDGIPLAIELAAARANLLTVEQINERLKDRFRLLTVGSRVSLPRHQTLQALIDWSYDLLSEAERILLRRLAVFAGGWTLEAAERVCSGQGLDQAEVLELLAGLVNKSLVVADVEKSSQARYRYLETIQQYAFGHLLAANEVEDCRNRHLEYYVELAETGEGELYGPNQLLWFDLLEVDHDNLRLAMDWALESEQALAALRLPGALHYFWFVRGYFYEGVERSRIALERFAALPGTRQLSQARAKANIGAGFMAIWSVHDEIRAERQLVEGLELARELDDQRLIALALDFLAFVHVARQEYHQAGLQLLESLEIYRLLGDDNHAGRTQAFIGDTLYLDERLAEAKRYYEAGLSAFREAGNANYLTYATRRLGYVHLRLGEHDQARELFSESLQLNLVLKEQQGVASCLEAFANLALFRGELDRAAILYGAAEMVLDTYHTTLILVDNILWDRYLPQLRQTLGDEVFEGSWAVGYALTLDQAVAFAQETG